jgi:uncharacterized membrane protein
MRRSYLDVMRGLAVLIMVEAHALDSWTRDVDRTSTAYGYAQILGGFGAPIFLFLAGVAVPMSAGSKLRKGLDRRAAARAVQRRGAEIFLLAFLFRLQAYLLSPGSHLYGLLKVDILNIMGPSIVAAALIWQVCRSPSARAFAFALTAAAISLVTPLVRGAQSIAALPDALEAYLRPVPNLANFTIFPWMAFLFAGAVAGAVIDEARTASQEARTNTALAIGGTLLAIGGYAASLAPPIYANSNFWTSSPTFFAMRVGIITVAIATAYGWQRAFDGRGTSALQLLGLSSLFVYWIHVEMVYGLLASPIRRQLALPVMFTAYAVFMFMLYVVVRIKNDLTGRSGTLNARSQPRVPEGGASGRAAAASAGR